MSFQWKDRYNLDIPSIDTQHKKLFEIGARVYDLTVADDNYDHYDEILIIINELLEYTEYHFKYEEELMNKYGYNELSGQQHDHAFYIDKIKSIASKDIDEKQNETLLSLVDFLSQWISSHIVFSDRKYAVYFKENGIEPN